MGLDFSKMSSTTIFSIALLAALVILLIVLIIVTVKVLSKGKKDDEEEYTERRYTTRKGEQEEAEDSGSRKAPKPAKTPKPKKVEEDDEDDEDDDEDEEDDEDGKASDEDADEKPEVKDEVAAVVEAALQAKAKAAELEARVAKEKAEKAAAEAEQAARKASEAEAEAEQAAAHKKKSAAPEMKAPVAEAPGEEEPEAKDEDEFGQTDEIPVARINHELEKQKQKEADVLKATTRIADADQIIEAVKEAKGKKSKADEETLLAEEAAEVAEAVAAAEAAGKAAESAPAGEDSAFGESAPPLKEEETKKTLETTFDSAFTDTQLHQEIEGRKDELTDSAFGTEAPVEEEEIKPLQVSGETITVNPVNAVNITTVNAVEPVTTTNPEAGIHDAAEMSAFLQDNPVPKKKKKKMKKKDLAFADKFDHDGPEIKGAQYLWYNNQDIEALTKKEDMYYYCHYFNDPAKAVLPLIIEMYDCAFVRTEELQKIAYGIQYKSMGLREILTSKDNVSFDRSKIAKDPTEQDLLQIRAKWCDYVDNFLQIIVLQAPEQVQEYIRNQLYAYGENDVDTLLFCPEPEDEEE